MNSILHPIDTEDVVSDTSEAGEIDADRPSVSWDTPYSGALNLVQPRAVPSALLCIHHSAMQHGHKWSRGRGIVSCTTGVLEPEDRRVWEVLWKGGAGDGQLQRLTFEASLATRAFLHKQVEAWSVSLAKRCSDALRTGDISAIRNKAMDSAGDSLIC